MIQYTLPVLAAAFTNMVVTWWDPQTRWFLALVNTAGFVLACFFSLGKNTTLFGRVLLVYVRFLMPILIFTWIYHLGIMLVETPDECVTDLIVATSVIGLMEIQWLFLIAFSRRSM